jgi:hypothetical protein
MVAVTPSYMRRYFIRVSLFMVAYVLILTIGLSLARGSADLAAPMLFLLALLSALPIIGVFWAIFRLLIEIDDGYQRLLFVKQTLIATAITLATVTVWQFLEVYDVVATGPRWTGAIWFAMLGVAGPIARWRA